jgi:uncharacterized repeat protein (TIGR01451 family)
MRRQAVGVLVAVLLAAPLRPAGEVREAALQESPSGCPVPSLAGASFPSASFPTELSPIDFDSDGFPDLAVVNQTSQDVLLLRNDRTGLFVPAGRLAVGGSPTAIAAGDLTGDGLVDLLVNSSTLNTVTVFSGDGSGGFSALPALPTGTTPRELAIGDLDGDLLADVVTANNGGTVSLIRGTGAGAFAARVDLTIGGNPRAIVIADVDENGTPDLAVARFGASSVAVLKGLGGGVFGPQANLTVGSSPVSIGAADLNGDAHVDLAVVNQTSNTASILLGSGAGTFAPAATFTAGLAPRDLAIADLNGDGALDLVSADNAGTLTVLNGDGTGQFAYAATFPSDPNTRGVAVADVNLDGRPDLAAANTGNTTRVFYNTCRGPEVAIQKSHSGTFVVGNEAAFTLTVTNNGPDPTAGPITVTDTLPAGLSFHSHFGSRWHCTVAAPAVSCVNNDPLAPGASVSFQLNVNVGPAAAPSSVNVATVTTAGDSNPSNNRASDTALASATANLGIAMIESSDPALYNEDLVYTLTVTNYGASPAIGIEVTDVLPTTVAYRSSDSAGGRCFLAIGTTVKCLLDDLPSGSSVQSTITVRPISFSTITNTASVKGTFADPVTANNKATQNTIVLKLSAFAIAPTAVAGCAAATGTVTLNGAAPASGALVTFASNKPAAIVPASILVPPGATTASFPIATAPVTATQYAAIVATLSTKSTTKNLQVRPMGVGSLALDPATIQGGQPSQGLVQLECPAPTDTLVTLTSSSPTAAKPAVASLVIPAGEQAATFPVITFATTSVRTVTITATANRIYKTAKLTVQP